MSIKTLLIPLVLVVAAGGYWAVHVRDSSSRSGDLTLYGNLDIREANLAFNAAERIGRSSCRRGTGSRPVRSWHA